ncbi:hypothetical protein [Williamsia sp.]|uniref:hypothetical protein n=1 Tax=Williamsia sp. TaxID=1872085 RepID=UPI001A280EB7|nr:hypothetical protein [Williamsia sp.]MBJ7287549.1 hypothetical protein [Williamsia sp.]
MKLLSRSGPGSSPTSGGHWIGIALVLFVCARFLHLPVIENFFDGLSQEVDGSGRWYNVPYFLTITSTTLALGYCVPATAWVVGYGFNPRVPHWFAAMTGGVLFGAFATSNLRNRPISYLPDAFDSSLSQSIFWAYVALAIAVVGVAAIALIGRASSEFVGAIRAMMVLIGLASVTAILFSIHIVLRVFVVHMAPNVFPSSYVEGSSLIAVSLTTLVTVLLVAALMVPQVIRLVDRVQRYRLLTALSDSWLRSRSAQHRNHFDDIRVPVNLAQCWRASATPVVTHRMMFEISQH